jgi:hypothetical protein
MVRNRFVRPALAFCCSLALLLYLVAPAFAQGTQAPAPKSGTTQGMQQNPGTSGTSAQSTTPHKKQITKKQTTKKKTTKQSQGTTDARQKPGSSSTTNEQKGNMGGQKNGSANDTNSGNPPR